MRCVVRFNRVQGQRSSGIGNYGLQRWRGSSEFIWAGVVVDRDAELAMTCQSGFACCCDNLARGSALLFACQGAARSAVFAAHDLRHFLKFFGMARDPVECLFKGHRAPDAEPLHVITAQLRQQHVFPNGFNAFG